MRGLSPCGVALFFLGEDVRLSRQPEPGLYHEGAGAVEVADYESGEDGSQSIKHHCCLRGFRATMGFPKVARFRVR